MPFIIIRIEVRMQTFIVGGTGFLGYYTVRELLARGHKVATIALPPAPPEGVLPEGVNITPLGHQRPGAGRGSSGCRGGAALRPANFGAVDVGPSGAGVVAGAGRRRSHAGRRRAGRR